MSEYPEALTPPKFIAAMREREEDELVARLRALESQWRNLAETLKADLGTQMWKCADELQDVIENRPTGE